MRHLLNPHKGVRAMSKFLEIGSVEANNALFNSSPPILVEVRFPESGTSPDWYLCDDLKELVEIVDTLGAGLELYLSSVWDLKNQKARLA
jgi:hypothetical protein